MKQSLIFLLLFIAVSLYGQRTSPGWRGLASPDTVNTWIQPVQGKPAMPVWGHAQGILVGLAPLPGPRGLIRIYTPYLDYEFAEVMNFIAFEPIPKGSDVRGYSELERSSLDEGQNGKRFWSADDSTAVLPRNGNYPARGVVEQLNGEETLTVYIFSEPFDNGAKVYVRLRFFASKPYEFEIATYTSEGSIELDYFIASATMGNKARLRTLFFKDKNISSLEIWPDYKDIHFTLREYFPQKDMIRDKNGNAYFIAAPDEKDYSKTIYAPGTNNHWKYTGRHATQYWMKNNPEEGLNGVITGRYTYWASEAPIPGGISIENLEMNAPFKNGDAYIFGITPRSPEELIKENQK